MLRILTLNYEFPPIGGGGGNAHGHLLSEFASFPDLDVTMVTVTPRKEVQHRVLSPNVEIIQLPIRKKDLLFWRRREIVQYLLMHIGFCNKFLQNRTYDLSHVFFGFPTGVLAYLHRKKLPYLVSVRGSDVPGYNRRFSLDYIFLRPLLERIYRHAAKVVANSSGLKELYERQFSTLRAEVIPNGVDTVQFAPCFDPELFGKNRLVTVARLIPRKGIDLLIHACAAVRDKGIDFQCHIIGDGPERNRLQRLVGRLNLEAYIYFHGNLDKTQIAGKLPQFNLFVLPSYAEGMSNAALEAMACGLPLLLTDTGGSRELIDGNGIIVPPGNVSELTRSLCDLLTQPARLHAMGERSRQLANAFSWPYVAGRYRELYYQCAGREPL